MISDGTPVAAAGARPGHRPGHPLRRWTPRGTWCTTRSSTSAPASRTTGCGRSPRSSATSSRAARSPSATPAATTAATGSRSRRSTTSCPGFECEWDAVKGAAQLHQVFRSIDMDVRPTSPAAATPACCSCSYLISTGQVDADSLLEPLMIIQHDRHRGRRSSSTWSSAPTIAASSPAPSASTSSAQPVSADRGRAVQPVRQPPGRHAARACTSRSPRIPRRSWSAASAGAIFDIIVDMRPRLADPAAAVAVELTADNRRALYVPPSSRTATRR